MPVIVVNKHDWKKGGTWIGRGGVLGNPYTHLPLEKTQAKFQVATREESIECYRVWADKQWVEDEYFRLVLTGLAIQHLKGETVVLACVCKPDACHGDVLKELIEALVDFGVVTLEKEYEDAF